MNAITIGQIAVVVTFVAGLISGTSVILKATKKWIAQSMKDQLDSINSGIDSLSVRIDEVDMQATKNFLVARLSELDDGKQLGDVAMERFWEELEHYEKQGGNSYIHRKVEQLKSEGKL